MTEGRNTIRISGGTFQGSAVGIGHVEQPGYAAGPSVAALRAALAAVAPALVESAGSEDDRADIRHEIRKIDQELAVPEPDAAAVRSRWKSVLAVLGEALAAGEQVARITELVRTLFGW